MTFPRTAPARFLRQHLHPGQLGPHGRLHAGRPDLLRRPEPLRHRRLNDIVMSDPSDPKQLPRQFLGDGRPHDVWLNEAGTRLYAGQPGTFGAPAVVGPNGLVILDVSDYQFRRPNPQIRIISKLFWEDRGSRRRCFPSRTTGASTSSADEPAAIVVPAASRPHVPGGRPRMVSEIIDITDERNPKIIAKLMLEVHDPANCALLINDPPEAGGGIPGYNGERCNADRVNNPTMLACAYQDAGLRVFDIRDLYGPKRSRTTSHRLCGRLSFPDQLAGDRASIEPSIG